MAAVEVEVELEVVVAKRLWPPHQQQWGAWRQAGMAMQALAVTSAGAAALSGPPAFYRLPPGTMPTSMSGNGAVVVGALGGSAGFGLVWSWEWPGRGVSVALQVAVKGSA